MPLSTIHIAYEYQKLFVERNLTVTVEDCEIDPEEFNELFGTYLRTV